MARPSLACVLLLSVSLVVALPVAIDAQQSQQPSPTRDQQAVSVITQCLNATGGQTAIAAVADYKGTGTVTYYWAVTGGSGSTTIQGRGTDQFRIDSSIPAGTYTMLVDRGSGEIKDVSGKIKTLYFANAVNKGNLTFPLPELTARLEDSTVSITDGTVVTFNGRQAYRVRTVRNLPSDSTANQVVSKLTTRDFFIDQQTLQVLGTRDAAHPDSPIAGAVTHEMQFSNYQTVNGVSVPFTITELVGGQTTWTIQLTQIAFNVGLSDSNFQP
jgi:hypothetical protein